MASTQSIDAEKAREFAVETVETLRQHGFISYWAGGCVRDHHLQLTPKDYDVATNAVPDEIRKLFGRRRTLAIGASFGVITLIGSKQQGNIEIATFREDVSYSDGRRPDRVSYSTPELDAQRRDFTINGMFLDPLTMETIDYVQGREDLGNQLVRAIGIPAERFEEDKLRIFRAIRFATTLGFDIEAETLQAVCTYVEKLSQVSRERILIELEKTLASPNRLRGLELLQATGVLPYVLPDTTADEDQVELAKAVLASLPVHHSALTFAALYHTLAPQRSAKDVKKTIKSMKASNDIAEATFWILENFETLLQAGSTPWPKIQKILIHQWGTITLQLARAVAEATQSVLDGVTFCEKKLQLAEQELNPAELLSGADLIQLGMTPGPAFSKVLTTVRDQQLLGNITTKVEAEALARSTYQSIHS